MHHPRHPLEAALDHLVAVIQVEDHPADMALWATAMLASRLGVSIAASNETHPLLATEEIGLEWAEQIIELMGDYPTEQADTLRVAWSVVQRLVEDVRRRGLADGPTRRLHAGER